MLDAGLQLTSFAEHFEIVPSIDTGYTNSETIEIVFGLTENLGRRGAVCAPPSGQGAELIPVTLLKSWGPWQPRSQPSSPSLEQRSAWSGAT